MTSIPNTRRGTTTAMRWIAALAAGTLALAGTTLTAATAAPPPAAPGSLAGGALHTVSLAADGRVFGLGNNTYGQVTGTGGRPTLTAFTGLPAGVVARAVAARGSHSLVQGSNGIVYGTGLNTDGQLTGTGDRSTLTPLTGLPGGVKVTAVAAGEFHSLAIGSDGVVYGTGWNGESQLTGTGDRSTLTPLTGLPNGVRATAVAAGPYTTLVVGSDGRAYGAGANDFGQLTGAGSRTTLTALTGLPAGVRATAVAFGSAHSLVLGSNGIVYGTGRNSSRQITGTGDRSTLAPLTGLPAGVSATAITAGDYHSSVLGSDGQVYGTGANSFGQITGTGERSTLTPFPRSASDDVVAIGAGKNTTLVRTADGLVYGTGLNTGGQLGAEIGTEVHELIVVAGMPVVGTEDPVAVGAARVGSVVRVTPGSWTPAPSTVRYEWRVDGALLPGQSTARYTPTANWVGRGLTVTVIAERSARLFAPGSRTISLGKIAKGLAPKYGLAKKPTIKGTKKVGKKLSITKLKKTAFSPTATKVTYQWLRGGKKIKGATKSSYRLKKADAGKKISLRVTATRTGHTTATLTTKAVRIKR